MWWTLIILILLLIVVTIFISNKRNKKLDQEADMENVFTEDFFPVGTYIGGQPDNDQSFDNCVVARKENELVFYKKLLMENPVYYFSIRISDIYTIETKDILQIEHQLESGEWIQASDFVFNPERTETGDTAFLSIEWSKNKMRYFPTFFFESNNALQQANTAKNNLMKLINKEV